MRAALLLLCLAVPAGAQESPELIAKRAAGQLAAAQAALAAADTAGDRVTALTRTIRAYEDGLTALRDGLRRAAIREAALRRRFETERDKVMRLMGALLSIEASPAPLLLLHPSGPVGTARSGMIVSEVAPGLQREAERLRHDLQEIETLRALQESAEAQLLEALQGVQAARTELSKAISNRTQLPVRLLKDPAALARLIDSAETLQAFADGLTDLEEAGATLPDFLPSADVALPVAGAVLRRAGETDAAGVTRPGIVVATEPRALVTAPWAATVRYRGPLLDYGNVMILEPAGGHLLVLAGLAEVYGEVGEVVPAGTPVGLMGGAAPERGAFLAQPADETGAGRTETLYIEARQDDAPIDPARWFAIE